VQQAIDGMLARGREPLGNGSGPMTVLIVAHRLSTVRNADKIIVIREGQVVEVGKHTDLVELENGVYASLIKRQMEAQSQLETGNMAEGHEEQPGDTQERA
jgi:ABC-type multidrug transport system fused ATPase/permease subunit